MPHTFCIPRTPGRSTTEIIPASSKTFTCNAADDWGIPNWAAISLIFADLSIKNFNICKRISDDNAFPTSAVCDKLFKSNEILFLLVFIPVSSLPQNSVISF